MDTRWQEIRDIWKRTNGLWLFAGLALGGMVGFLAGASIHTPIDGWFLDGAWPELIGIGITVFALERLAERRALRQYKHQLVRDARSQSRDIAVRAMGEIRRRDWAGDSSATMTQWWQANIDVEGAYLVRANDKQILKGAFLSGTNLEGAKMMRINLEGAWLNNANLIGAQLWFANLSGAELSGANLSGANLDGASLIGANLWRANLSGARLWEANLEDAKLQYTDLSGADLRGASLIGADLRDGKFSKNTILPDNTNWTPDITNEEMTERFGVVFEKLRRGRQRVGQGGPGWRRSGHSEAH